MPDAATPPAPLFRERLWPSPWVFAATALVIPAALLTFLPISVPAGIATAILFEAIVIAALIGTSPVIEVTPDEFRAGRAHLPRTAVGDVEAFEGAEAVAERGVRLDARAWLLLRGWAPAVVRVEVVDDSDPVPYWLVSTKRPRELAEALSEK